MKVITVRRSTHGKRETERKKEHRFLKGRERGGLGSGAVAARELEGGPLFFEGPVSAQEKRFVRGVDANMLHNVKL